MTGREPPYPSDTRAKGWRFEVDHERIRQSDTWALAPADLRPWFLMLWMVAWEQTPCGSLPEDDTLIAARIGMSPKTFQRHRALLMRGWWLADDGRLYHDVLVQRVREMLAKRVKDAIRAANKRGRDADHALVTDESRVTRSGVRGESDTKHQAPSTEKKPTVSGRGSRLPTDWNPGESGFAFANQQGLINGKAQTELERFRDFWCAAPGQKGVKTDWQATWRNWVRKAVEFQPKVPGQDLNAMFRKGAS